MHYLMVQERDAPGRAHTTPTRQRLVSVIGRFKDSFCFVNGGKGAQAPSTFGVRPLL